MELKSILLSLILTTALFSTNVLAKDDPQKFQAAVNACSTQCQAALLACQSLSPKAGELFKDGHFCDLMNYKENGVSAKDCLTETNACTGAEYNKLKDAACGAGSLVVSFAAVIVGVAVSLVGKLGL